MRARTQVVILGAGPAGLLLSHLLARQGVESIVLEIRSRQHVLSRIRAGVLEHGSVELLRSSGLGGRPLAEGFVHEGVHIANAGSGFRIDFRARTGKAVTIYGQTQLQQDLFRARDEAAGIVIDEVSGVAIQGADSNRPSVTYRRGGNGYVIEADFIAGCDGSHGVSRLSMPASLIRTYERVYPSGWLGVLSETPPAADELIYARHERGFALCSMRNRNLSRYYVQCSLKDSIEAWPDARFWRELCARLPEGVAESLVTGPSIEKSITPLRSFIVEPMRYGRLLLAGDAAHIVPPTGAKGLNLAISDVALLSRALGAYYREHSETLLDSYSHQALARAWNAVRFSWWLTNLLHRYEGDDPFAERLKHAELEYIRASIAAQTAFAENYVGSGAGPHAPSG